MGLVCRTIRNYIVDGVHLPDDPELYCRWGAFVCAEPANQMFSGGSWHCGQVDRCILLMSPRYDPHQQPKCRSSLLKRTKYAIAPVWLFQRQSSCVGHVRFLLTCYRSFDHFLYNSAAFSGGKLRKVICPRLS